MNAQRTITGISGIDELIEGGFPPNSMIILTGPAGAGKSTFASQFLYNCAVKYKKRGVYVCFTETKECFLCNMRGFGWDFEQLENRGKISTLSLSVSKEAGVQTNINKIIDCIMALKADVVVADPFSSMIMPLNNNIDVQVMINLLYKFIKKRKCLCILIVDKPQGNFHSFSSGEEIIKFTADGIIDLNMYVDDNGELQRRITIIKMRGTNHSKLSHPYIIDKNGFRVLHTKKEAKLVST